MATTEMPIKNSPPFTFEEMAAGMKREAGMRRSVYKKQAGDKPLPAAKQRDIDLMDYAGVYFEAEASKPPLATEAQRQEIIRLINHPVITRREKAAMLLGVCHLKEDRAADAIANIKLAIDLRENFTIND